MHNTANRTNSPAYKIVRFIASIFLLPLKIFYKLEKAFLKTEEAFLGISCLLSLIPGVFGNIVRAEFYKGTVSGYGENSWIFFGSILTHPTVRIGKNVSVGLNCTIGTVAISDNVLIGSNVDILSGRHQHSFNELSKPIREQEINLQRIFIGENSWVGNSSVIMSNIGKGCVVGAGSVVVDDVADFSVVAGNPAKVIKKRVNEVKQDG